MPARHWPLRFASVWFAAGILGGPARLAGAAADRAPDHVFSDGTEIHLLDAQQGAEAILDDGADPFYDRLSLLEISLRLGRDLETNDLQRERERFKAFVRECVVDWTEGERRQLLGVARSVHAKCSQVAPGLIPRQWRFIKTDGRESFAAYTRGSCIVFPQAELRYGVGESLLIHETFHVYSRMNPPARERLYAAIGFRDLTEVALPPSLARRRITNPDGASHAYAITVQDRDGRSFDAVPVLLSQYATRKPDLRGLLPYISFALFEVERHDGVWRLRPGPNGLPKPHGAHQVQGFFSQVGGNTDYLIHPDEILADNVALLVLVRSGEFTRPVDSPEVLDRLEALLRPSPSDGAHRPSPGRSAEAP